MPQYLGRRAHLPPRPSVGNHNQVQKWRSALLAGLQLLRDPFRWHACMLDPAGVSPKAPFVCPQGQGAHCLPAQGIKKLSGCPGSSCRASSSSLVLLGAPADIPMARRGRQVVGRALVFIRPFLWSGTIGILNISSRLLSLFCRQLPKVM